MSLLKKKWSPSNFPIAMTLWKNMVQLCQVQLAMLPEDRYIELRFEDLVSNPSPKLMEMCAFIGIEYEDKMIMLYLNEWSNLPDSVREIHENLQGSLPESQCFTWKQDIEKPDQTIDYEIAGDILSRHDYDISITHQKLKITQILYHRFRESIAWRFNRPRR